MAVGYYGDSTLSQHGYLYNTLSGQYTFLDDPDAAFSNGVEVTQITGINNQGEITGFYTDAGGLAHGFVATPIPEPGTLALDGERGSRGALSNNLSENTATVWNCPVIKPGFRISS